MQLPTEFSDVPKLHKDPVFLEAKRARFSEPHVAPVNSLVVTIRVRIAQAQQVDRETVYVPNIDPDSGGVAATVLLLLESPAGPAALGSGMLSADNDDETAKNVWHAYGESGLARTAGLHWNAVPWYVGTEKRNAPVTPADIALGRTFLEELLALSPALRVVVAMGRKAQVSVAPLTEALGDRGVHLVECIHPGPQNYNTAARHARARVHAAFRAARVLAG